MKNIVISVAFVASCDIFASLLWMPRGTKGLRCCPKQHRMFAGCDEFGRCLPQLVALD